MFDWIKNLFDFGDSSDKPEEEGSFIEQVEIVGKAKVHPSLRMRNIESVIYYAVDDYTSSNYIRLAEELAEYPFLTAIDNAPLTFQIGTSNVTISPERYGNGVIFHRTMVVRRPKSLIDPFGFLRFWRNGTLTTEEAFEELNESDQLDVIYAMSLFARKL